MSDKIITINGTSTNFTITPCIASTWSFIAVDADGEVWLFDREPKIRNDHVFRGFTPDLPGDCCETGLVIHNIGGAWVDTLTDIHDAKQVFIVSNPDAMADAIAALIRGRTVSDDLLDEVTALIKAGN